MTQTAATKVKTPTIPSIGILTQVQKRDGRIVPFDASRITRAITLAMEAVKEGDLKNDPPRVSEAVMRELQKKYASGGTPDIEGIQDVVEEQLILMDFPKAAKAYILYRHKRAEVREKAQKVPAPVKKLVRDSKKYFSNPLAEFIYYRSYSRWIDAEGRRETWIESVRRYIDFMRENLGKDLKDEEYEELRTAILKQEAMPSMRLLWSAGHAARVTNVAAYNCSFIAPTRLEDFAEIMYLSMCGTGVGFSVESQTAQQLPQIKMQSGDMPAGGLPIYTIEDSKEGWANALTHGLKTWYSGKDVEFDFSKLRPEGARLKTMGGKASGPGPLRDLMAFARRKVLARQGKRLSNLDVHDIICKIGDIVVSGGVRRSALISLSDSDDIDMRFAKDGQFYIKDPQRSLANNSAVYMEKPTTTQFMEEWLALAKSGSGERGIFNRGGLKHQVPARRWKVLKHTMVPPEAPPGTNPCITGGTLVYVADGRGHVPIQQLAREQKDVPVFCLDANNKMAIRYMRNPRVTGNHESVYKITLDDGSVIKATSDHKFRLKSGDYRKVKDLVRGDSLEIATRFEASIKDVFPEANARSQNYWWVNQGKARNSTEHRLITEFYYNTKIPKGWVVHHRDRNAQNNHPENLEIMTKENHDRLHSDEMKGDKNPMRKAHNEWSERQWEEYRLKHSVNNRGEKNRNFSGVTDDMLRMHAIKLTQHLGRRFSNRDWMLYAKEVGLPQFFSKWRRDHLGGVLGFAKEAARRLGLDFIEADPRVVASYDRYTAQGYNCGIINGQLVILKKCEVCGASFETNSAHREYGVCSISCGLKRMWSNPSFKHELIARIHGAHRKRKNDMKEAQAKIYSDLKFALGRDPLKKEWIDACSRNNISSEIARTSSPFRKYQVLKEYSELYNHKVMSVEWCGYEDVYNGTVDEFHNFFVGGFESKTKNNKKKFVYLNNLQCGEIILQSKQFCNLTEVVARADDTEETLLRKMRLATILGTYQATLTNFPYLSRDWTRNCNEERLLGVSITGQWDSPAVRNPETLKKMREESIRVNKEYAARFGIAPSTSITCVKPSGTVSQLVDSSSGMHPRHAKYYIRRVRISATDSLFHMLKDQKVPYKPEVGQAVGSANTYVIEFPVKAPSTSTTFRDDLSALDQLEHWKTVKENYTEHNPSVTVSVGDKEWLDVAHWLYGNWDTIGGLSFLPREDAVYQLAPYEEITEAEYKKMKESFPDIDFSQIVLYEKSDETEGAKELACVSGVCEV
ncbi:MAG: HNH endonuclease [Candidatus Niyogibacteria bacterium]|nr:HNH endonuclease [Candidatus Niyogibacteria bacterium]